MGIGKQTAKDLIVAAKAATATKHELKAELEDAMRVIITKIQALDQQLAQATVDFAAGKPSQFSAFVASLPDVGDPVP